MSTYTLAQIGVILLSFLIATTTIRILKQYLDRWHNARFGRFYSDEHRQREIETMLDRLAMGVVGDQCQD